MTYQEMMENAKLSMGLYCKACPVCDGRACKNQIPGPGAKGVGDTAIRNYKKWQEIRVNMDTICDGGEADTSVNLFGKESVLPHVLLNEVGFRSEKLRQTKRTLQLYYSFQTYIV